MEGLTSSSNYQIQSSNDSPFYILPFCNPPLNIGAQREDILVILFHLIILTISYPRPLLLLGPENIELFVFVFLPLCTTMIYLSS